MSDNEILDKIIDKLQEKHIYANVNDIKDFRLTLSGSEYELVYRFSCKDKAYYYIINTMSENLYEA